MLVQVIYNHDILAVVRGHYVVQVVCEVDERLASPPLSSVGDT